MRLFSGGKIFSHGSITPSKRLDKFIKKNPDLRGVINPRERKDLIKDLEEKFGKGPISKFRLKKELKHIGIEPGDLIDRKEAGAVHKELEEEFGGQEHDKFAEKDLENN